MNFYRAAIRTIILITGTCGLSLALLGSKLAARGSSLHAGVLADRYAQKWARWVSDLIGMRVLVDGEVPKGPVALVMNHLSYIDIVALWSVMPGVFVARADVASWPLIGRAGKLIGTIFIDRTRKRDLLRVIPEMEQVLREGRSIIFFPEGTSSRGEEVLDFKSSLFAAPARTGAPVVSASLQFEARPGETSADWSVCWWADMPFASHAFALMKMPGFDARIRFASPAENGPDRKALCRLAQEAVEKNFEPTTPVDGLAASPSELRSAELRK